MTQKKEQDLVDKLLEDEFGYRLKPNTIKAYSSDLKQFFNCYFDMLFSRLNETKKNRLLSYLGGTKYPIISEKSFDLAHRIKMTINAKAKNPKAFTKRDIRKVLSKLKKENNPASSTMQRKVYCLKWFAKYLCENDYLDYDFMSGIKAPKIERKIPDYLSEKEITDLISLTNKETMGLRDKTMMGVLYKCGLRVEELVNMKKESINFENRSLKVTGKRDKQRIIPLTDDVFKLLNYYIDEMPNLYKKIKEPFLFLNPTRGRKLTTRGVRNIIVRYATKIGLEHKVTGPHIFRHSFATHLVQKGVDLAQVQDLLGHADPSTTKIYAQNNPERLRAAVEKLN